MAIKIREATTEDANAIAKLLNQLGYSTTHKEMALHMEQVNVTPGYCCLLAVEDNVIIGMIGFSKCLEINDGYVRIQTLEIVPRHTTSGIGKYLIDACKAWGEANGTNLLIA